MGVVAPIKGPSSALMTCSGNFIFDPNYVNRYHPKIISYLPLVDSSTGYLHVTAFVALSAGKVKSTLTLMSVVIFLSCLCYCIGAYLASFFVDSFWTSLPNTIIKLHPLYNKM